MKSPQRFLIVLVILVLAITACRSAAPTSTPENTDEPPAATTTAPQPEAGPSESADPSPTTPPTAAPTPAVIELPEAEREQLLSTYKALLLVQINTGLLEDTARKIESGELSGFENFGAVLVTAAMLGASEEAFKELEPSDILKEHWLAAKAIHDQTRELMGRWVDEEINASDVLSEIEEPLVEIETIMTRAESELAERYGIDSSEMKAAREEIMTKMEDIFATPTAIPEGVEGPVAVLSHQQYVDHGYYTIIGEVQNNSAEPMEYVKVVATLYDDQEQMIGTEFTYTTLDTLPAGGKSPFEISTSEYDGAATYKIQVQGQSATAEEPALSVLSHRQYLDGGYYTIIGEVQNTSDDPMTYVKLVTTLYDTAGQVVGVGFTYSTLDAIPAGGRSPFEIMLDHWEGAESYALEVQGQAGELPRQDLTITNHYSSPSGDYLTIEGEVANQGTTPAEFVKVVVTLYDADGNVVGVAFTYTTLDEIAPGGTSPFEIMTDRRDGFDHYDIQVQGQ